MNESEYRVADRLAIQELVHRYALLVDTHQLEPLLELFCPDAEFDESVLGPEAGPFRSVEAIRGYFARSFPLVSGMMHLTMNLAVEFVAAAQARGTSTLLFEGRVWDGSAQRIRGYFHDTYRRDAGSWRFRTRVLQLMSPVQPLIQPL